MIDCTAVAGERGPAHLQHKSSRTHKQSINSPRACPWGSPIGPSHHRQCRQGVWPCIESRCCGPPPALASPTEPTASPPRSSTARRAPYTASATRLSVSRRRGAGTGACRPSSTGGFPPWAAAARQTYTVQSGGTDDILEDSLIIKKIGMHRSSQ